MILVTARKPRSREDKTSPSIFHQRISESLPPNQARGNIGLDQTFGRAGGMPTIFRQGGFRFLFYANEGNPREPVHIHVIKDGIDAKFWLNPVRLAYNDGFDARVLRDLLTVVESNASRIEEAWDEFFG